MRQGRRLEEMNTPAGGRVFFCQGSTLAEMESLYVLSRLKPGHRARLARKNARDRQNSLAALFALFSGLEQLFPGKIPKQPLSFSASGQPVLQEKLGFCSLAHDGTQAAAAISFVPVGIDLVAQERKAKKAVSRLLSTVKEPLNALPESAAEEQARLLWGKMEAVGKLMGCGIPLPASVPYCASSAPLDFTVPGIRFDTKKQADCLFVLAEADPADFVLA